MLSLKVNKITKALSVCSSVETAFVITLGKSMDEAFGVELPAYVREELIAILKGEW